MQEMLEYIVKNLISKPEEMEIEAIQQGKTKVFKVKLNKKDLGNVIGKNGSKIKEIGIRARKDIEELLNKKVYLDLFVKVMPKWRDRENLLKELGIKLYKDE